MNILSKEQRAYAVAQIVTGMGARGFQQQDLHDRSGVAQSTISRIVSPSPNDHYEPTEETLKKLFKGLGLNFDEIMGDIEAMPRKLIGYLATPLTSVVGNGRSEQPLSDLVTKVKNVVCSDRFPDPTFDLYWPGDYTHPTRNQNFTAAQVYLTDRSQASSFDFVVMICASPSYGVGQENEIVTQAGLPAIRLVPHGISRMMAGSFLYCTDIEYSGTLETLVDFSEEELFSALVEIRPVIFGHLALYKTIGNDDFRLRLKDLVDDRCGNNLIFAKRLGVNIRYHCCPVKTRTESVGWQFRRN
jgi:transcriptional regulator with XRE-family HTH domain